MVWTAKKQLLEGKYTIEEVLPPNRGITYLAKAQNGVPAVIKTLNDEFRHDTDFQQLQQSFVTEAGKLAKCHHPHIVRHFETFLEDDVWCVAMEYCSYSSNRNRTSPLRLPHQQLTHRINLSSMNKMK